MIEYFFLATMGVAFSWMVMLALVFFARIKINEKVLSTAVKYYSLIMFLLGVILFGMVWHLSPERTLIDYPDWIKVGDYSFKLRVIIDLLGATYALLTSCLVGIIFKFSRNYLHREEGYFRFIFLLSTLLFGLMIVSFARSLDLLFAGWELVGTTSVLLIGYFYTQVQPVRHALKAIISYRLCDMGILAASAWAHHHLHTTDFTTIAQAAHDHSAFALMSIGGFIIWASLAKAGQLPMCSWLPAAMEGPTPSSAIFYGALSVHLGPFLLIRFYDYLEHFPLLLWVIGGVGLLSALYASLVGRTRSDAKTMLAYATISQVGLMYIEIALGYTNFAMFHMVTHASLRTYQFLRSASLIQDFTDNPMVHQNEIISRKLSFETMFSKEFKRKVYIHALHGLHLDYFTTSILKAICWPFQAYIQLENSWMRWDSQLLRKLLKRD